MLALKGLCPHWKYVLVCEEKHEDGSPHLHALVQLKQRKDITNPRFFDLDGYHPKIEVAKDIEGSITYIKKDGNVIEEGIPSIPSKKKQKLSNKDLLEGDLKYYVDNDLLSLTQLPGILKARQAYAMISANDNPTCIQEIPNHWDNLSMPLYDHTVKQKHYWLWSSEPNKGKTTFQRTLRSLYRCSDYSCEEKFQQVKKDSQFLLFDEFAKGNLVTITKLNEMCDGTYQFPVKGQPAVTLVDPIVIVCSNFSISGCYNNSNGRLEARFNEINLSDYDFI